MATIELRCEGTLHGRLTDNRWLEVKCKRRSCGSHPGNVVLHTIDIQENRVVKTQIFANPKPQRRNQNAVDSSTAAVRAS